MKNPNVRYPDCGPKGKDTEQIHDNYVMTWSGVDLQTGAAHGAVVIMHNDVAKLLLQTDRV